MLSTYIVLGAHRALPDVTAMESVITHQSLVSCLSKLPVRPPKTQWKLWIDQKRLFHRTTSLIRSLGKPAITAPQAKRLDALGLGHEELVQLHSNSKGREKFIKVLKDKGVNSKPLREKLAKLLHCKWPGLPQLPALSFALLLFLLQCFQTSSFQS